MEFSSTLQAVGTFGFPIVMSLLLAWYVSKLTDKFISAVHQMQRDSNEAIEDLKDTVYEHTATLQKLCDKLDKIERERDEKVYGRN